ncbi:gluconokinase [Rhodococcus sp. B50]|uniref:gluconokinase n=1 Tax=Rhodococcus sp. B50 TaxID=2682847 RepID=UPI001FD1586E|nr:gluconokinase, GntK/IdnK-type [Rhodococcus sp. B50]MBS9375345.1 Thermoresistant gluconokinase [Rhodococcus sp. B50]
MAVVVMGVSGCGKTTFARKLADAIGGSFIDADDYHSASSIEKMRAGRALDDRDRKPWLRAVAVAAAECVETPVIACSALKRSYRDILRAGIPSVFLHLDVPMDVVRSRVRERGDHFFSEKLVASQFETLEPLEPDEHGVVLDGTLSLTELLDAACSYVAGRSDGRG